MNTEERNALTGQTEDAGSLQAESAQGTDADNKDRQTIGEPEIKPLRTVQ